MPSREDKPEVFSLKRINKGWKLGRRGFLAGAAAAGLGLTQSKARAETPTHERKLQPTGKPDYKSCQSINGAVNSHLDNVDSVAINADASLIASGSTDRTIKLWSLPLGNLEATLKGHRNNVTALAFSPNGKWILSGDYDGKMKLWSVKKRKLLKKLPGHLGNVKGIAITPNNKFAVSVGNEMDDCLRLWSLPACKQIKRWGGDTAQRNSLATSQDGKYFVTITGGAIEFWSLEKGEEGKLIKKIEGDSFWGAPGLITFSPDGKQLVFGNKLTENLRIWSVSEEKLQKSINPHGTFGVYALAISPDGTRLVTAGAFEEIPRIWRFPSGKLLKPLVKAGDYKWTSWNGMAFDPNGDYLVTIHPFSVRIWDTKSWKLVRCLIDLKSTPSHARGKTYSYRSENGRKVTVTFPDCDCASPVPEGAQCTCDTVKGQYKGGGGGCGVVYYYPS